jgi:hypothetical protein
MNSLNFINKEIKATQRSYSAFDLDYMLFGRESDKKESERLLKKLKHLQQIKAELEAWYVVKEELQITSKSKNPYGEPLRRYELNVIGQNKIDTLNKALEVENEKSN